MKVTVVLSLNESKVSNAYYAVFKGTKAQALASLAKEWQNNGEAQDFLGAGYSAKDLRDELLENYHFETDDLA